MSKFLDKVADILNCKQTGKPGPCRIRGISVRGSSVKSSKLEMLVSVGDLVTTKGNPGGIPDGSYKVTGAPRDGASFIQIAHAGKTRSLHPKDISQFETGGKKFSVD